MKTRTLSNLKNTVLLLKMSVFLVLPVDAQEIIPIGAQEINCAEIGETNPNELPSLLLTEISETDYPYFLNVMSLKKYSNISYDGLPVECYENRNYKMTSNHKNLKLNVTYGDDGSLIKGSLIKIDTRLPPLIIKHLPAYRENHWNMVGNKTFIYDFDPFKTEYEVQLQRDNKKKTLFFDYSGKQIKKLNRY